MNKQNSSAGRELYHEIWREIKERFYDVERLSHWALWEHRYDEDITDDRSALAFAKVMVASLGDRYTLLVDSPSPTQAAHNIDCESAVTAKRFKCNIGCIKINSFQSLSVADQVEASLTPMADCDGFLVFVDSNPGGLLDVTLECLGLFFDQATLGALELRTSNGITIEEAYFMDDACVLRTIHPDGSQELLPIPKRKCLIADKPVAIVIGRGCGSSAELFAGALLANRRNSKRHQEGRSYNKRLCWSHGDRSGGKGIMQAPVDILKGRAQLKVSVGRFLSPDGHWFGDGQTDCRGIRPDFRVKGGPGRVCELALRHLQRQLHQAA